MAAKDLIHEIVKEALIKDGWTISHDPFTLQIGEGDDYYQVDLAAEKIITAEKGNKRIAVEIKSFTKSAVLYDFHDALGQFIDYRDALSDSEEESDRTLYLAVSRAAWHNLNQKSFIRRQIQRYKTDLNLLDDGESNRLDFLAKRFPSFVLGKYGTRKS